MYTKPFAPVVSITRIRALADACDERYKKKSDIISPNPPSSNALSAPVNISDHVVTLAAMVVLLEQPVKLRILSTKSLKSNHKICQSVQLHNAFTELRTRSTSFCARWHLAFVSL